MSVSRGEGLWRFFLSHEANYGFYTRLNGFKLFKPQWVRLRKNFMLSSCVVNEWNNPLRGVMSTSTEGMPSRHAFKLKIDIHYREQGWCFAIPLWTRLFGLINVIPGNEWTIKSTARCTPLNYEDHNYTKPEIDPNWMFYFNPVLEKEIVWIQPLKRCWKRQIIPRLTYLMWVLWTLQ